MFTKHVYCTHTRHVQGNGLLQEMGEKMNQKVDTFYAFEVSNT